MASVHHMLWTIAAIGTWVIAAGRWTADPHVARTGLLVLLVFAAAMLFTSVSRDLSQNS